MRNQAKLGTVFVLLATAATLRAADVRMYIADAANNLVLFDPSTRVGEYVGSMGAQYTDIAFAPNGRLYGVTTTLLYEIDPTDGWSTLIGSMTLSVPEATGTTDALAFGPDGVLYGAGNDVLISIDPATAATTVIGDLSGFRSAGDLAFTSDGRMLLTSDTGMLVEVDYTNGGATAIGALPFDDVYALGTDPDGAIYGVRAGHELLTIDPLSGAATSLGKLETDFLMGWAWGGSIPSTHAPETCTLVYLAITGVWWACRRPISAQTRSAVR